ncbi:hypothetical protein Zmor_023291 [Zophobas morio]|uniref:DNA/RNA non-specific endonuclease/pyrophosphatase/phosphodiesterase domain-containing protein n=2 Tax=Zophobas morio TaxID=2755281 RepID=A0AA38M699_9CUCU|nr:hypothetical protein Zmor_023291 [Zophobas morio]
MKATRFVLIFAALVQTVRPEGCNFAPFRVWQSVLLSAENIEMLYPPIENSPDNRNISLPVGATIIISCNGGRFSASYNTTKTIFATCNQDYQLEAQDTIVDFDNLDCINFSPVVPKVTSTPCAPNAVLIEVGFQIGLNIKFLPQVKICFDEKNLIPVYANYNLTKSIGFIKTYLSDQYVVDSVYNVDVDFDTLYDNVTYQEQQINKLLGLPEDSTQYVSPVSCGANPLITTPGFCFTRRTLAFRGDFVYTSQQKATFRYINVAPQWSFIDYNLDKLERNVVDFVKTKKLDLEVYTGTFGVATLPDANTGEEVKLFLHNDEKSSVMPVPLIFWKLIYERTSYKAAVFLVVNNPHLTQDDIPKNVICNDISDEFTWLTWEKRNATKGYSYACTYEDAKAAITYLPDLLVRGVLV